MKKKKIIISESLSLRNNISLMILIVILCNLIILNGNNKGFVQGVSEYSYQYTISSIFSSSCSGGAGKYLCNYVSNAVNHLNNIVKTMMFQETIVSVVFRIQSESNCQIPAFQKRTGFSYRVRFESGLNTGATASIFCKVGAQTLLKDRGSIISFEAQDIGFTSVILSLSSSSNITFTNCIFRGSSLIFGEFTDTYQMIPGPRHNSVLTMNHIDIPSDSKIRAAGFDSIVLDNVKFRGDTFVVSPSFFGNSRSLEITKSHLITKINFEKVDDVKLIDCETGDNSVLSIIEANQIVIDQIDYIGTFSAGFPVLFIGYSIEAYITNSNISMGTNWLFASSIIKLVIENVRVYDSQTQGSMIFISTCKELEINNLHCNNISATCLHIQDSNYFTVENSEFNNVRPNVYSGALYYTISYDTLIPTNDFYSKSILVKKSKFSNCTASSIYIESSSKFIVKGCDFYFNTAPKGGAIFYEYRTSVKYTSKVLSVEQSNFIGNGNENSYGGALYVTGFSSINTCYFERNTANKGGVIFFGEASNEVTVTVANDNVFHANRAKYGKIGYSEVLSNRSIDIAENYYYDNDDSISSPCFDFTYKIIEVDFNPHKEKNGTQNAYLGQKFIIVIEARNIFGRIIDTPKGPITLKVSDSGLFLKSESVNNTEFKLPFSLYSNTEVMQARSIQLSVTYERATYTMDVILDRCPLFYRYDAPGCVNIFYILPLVITLVAVTLIATCTGLIGCCVARYKSKLLKKRTKAESEMERVLLDKKLIFEESDDRPNSKASFIIPTEDITIEKRIGEGGQSMIYQGLWKGIQVAIKSIKDQDDEDVFEREGGLLISLRHPNIVTMYGFCVPNKKQKYMVIEFMKGGSLEKLINECRVGRQKLSMKQKLDILMGISRGMSYLHSLKPHMICHRDLKPANVLLDSGNSVKICDFGLSRIVGNNTFETSMTLNIGTLIFCPPESFDSGSSNEEPFIEQFSGIGFSNSSESIYYSNNMNSNSSMGSGTLGSSYSKEERIKNASKIDVYSFGIIMWSLFFEEVPYTTHNHKKMNYFTEMPDCNSLTVITQIVRGKRPNIPFSNDDQLKEWLSVFMKPTETQNENLLLEGVSKYIKLMQQCWHQLPHERPNFEEIIQILYEIARLCDDSPLFM